MDLYEIRPYSTLDQIQAEKDKAALFELMADWESDQAFEYDEFVRSLEAIIASESDSIILAFSDDGLAGYAQIGLPHYLGHDPCLEVKQLLVSAKLRGRGVGRAIMEYIQKKALAEGVKAIRLSSNIKRSRAHVFYEDLGFECFKISKFFLKPIGNG